MHYEIHLLYFCYSGVSIELNCVVRKNNTERIISTWWLLMHHISPNWPKKGLLMYTLYLKYQWIKRTMFFIYYKEPSLIIIIISPLMSYLFPMPAQMPHRKTLKNMVSFIKEWPMILHLEATLFIDRPNLVTHTISHVVGITHGGIHLTGVTDIWMIECLVFLPPS